MKTSPCAAPAALLLGGLCLTGCFHGLDRRGLEKRMDRLEPRAAAGGKAAGGQASTLRFPAAIGIYLAAYHWTRTDARLVAWEEPERTEVQGLASDLEAAGIASRVVVLPDPPPEVSREDAPKGDLPGGGNRSDAERVIEGAASQGLDLVLVLQGVADLDHRENFFSVLYALPIVGMAVSPGTCCEAAFLARATAWDPQSGKSVLTVEAEGSTRAVRPILWVHHGPFVDGARAVSFRALRADLLEKMKELRDGGRGEGGARSP